MVARQWQTNAPPPNTHTISYTLECNYNSGRQSNALTAATLDNGRASPATPYSPMGHRFSIQDFEQVRLCHDSTTYVNVMTLTVIMLQVGRALAISAAALDMYQLNPWSHLPTTEYGSVAGVRQRLDPHFQIKKCISHASYCSVMHTCICDAIQDGERLGGVD